jgi:CHAT domain-containing protein
MTLKCPDSALLLQSKHNSLSGLTLLLMGLLYFNACQQSNNTDAHTYKIIPIPKLDLAPFQAAIDTASSGDYAFAIQQLKATLPDLRQKDSLALWLYAKRLIGDYLYGSDGITEFDVLNYYDSTQTQIWREPKAASEWKRWVSLNNGELYIARSISDYVRVRKIFKRVEVPLRTYLYNRDPQSCDFFFIEKANLHVRDGEYANAERLFKECTDYRDKYKPAPKDMPPPYNDYGSLYLSQDSFHHALALFDMGLKDDTSNHFQRTLLHLNRVEALAGLGQYQAAQAENDIAQGLLSGKFNHSSEQKRCIYLHYENQGIIRAGLGQYQEAIKAYQQAIDYAVNNKAEPRTISAFMTASAKCWMSLQQPLRALEACQKAWRQFRPNATLSATELPDRSDLFADKSLISILEGKASAFAALGQTDKALQCYELIPTVEAQLRANHTYESSSLQALGQSRKRFDQAIGLAWSRYAATQDTQYIRRAFALTEQARGQLLLRSLEKAQLDYQLPDSVGARLNALQVRIGYYSRQIAEIQTATQPDAAKLADAEHQRDHAMRQWERFRQDTLYPRFPAYKAIEQEVQLVTASQVRSLLRPDQVLLDYYVAPDAMYVFRFDPSGAFSWRREPLTDGRYRQALDLVIQIVQSPAKSSAAHRAAFVLASQLLDSLLTAPERRTWRTDQSVIVIPDGRLAYLPLEVLLTQAPSVGADWGQLPYLALQHPISYAYSATLLQRQQSLTRTHTQSSQEQTSIFGGYAPRYKTYKLGDLPNAREEVADVQNILGGEVWQGANATEANFKTHAPRQRILLMAMHGEFNEANPDLSHLQFGDTIAQAAGDNDNILYANELSLLRLQADLAVMNACHSGNGTYQEGEGMYSLSRSLTIAGVPATLISLWQLSDKTSRTMICDFFDYMRKHPEASKDHSLHQSKRAFLAKEGLTDYGHPYFWSGLVAHGDMQPLSLPAHTPVRAVWLWMTAVVAAIGAGFWWLQRRKRTLILLTGLIVGVAATAWTEAEEKGEAGNGTFQRCCPHEHPAWGFFAHQRINRMAALTLPTEMLVFYKPNIEYITAHAVDPDMRRYAVTWEAPRHYIDLDEYGDDATALPRTWPAALATYCTIKGVTSAGDTVVVYQHDATRPEAQQKAWQRYCGRFVAEAFASEDKQLRPDSLAAFAQQYNLEVPAVTQVFFVEMLSAHGILPWSLQTHHRRLVQAFKAGDADLILKISAEIGHYIGDAHVPLHTTSNYNGQKTNQNGIHGFWESRIPELFADADYDYFVGKPTFIVNPTEYYWDMVLTSHQSVDSVLNIEQRLRTAFPSDQQMCPDVRQGIQVITQCRDFAAAYQADMQGMVERRMRAAIQAVASAWYSAWAEAGQPDLTKLRFGTPSEAARREEEAMRKRYQQGQIIGRPE